MLTAAVVRHGGSSHFVRPDRVYRTSVLEPATDGYQPDIDAQAVATEFTRIFGPGEGLAGELTWWQRTRLKWNLRKAERAVARRQRALSGLGALPASFGRDTPHNPGAIPVTGGWAPAFITQGQVGAQIALATGTLNPPGTAPAMVYAQGIAAGVASAPERFAQMLITDRIGGFVGERAGAAATQQFIRNRIGGR